LSSSRSPLKHPELKLGTDAGYGWAQLCKRRLVASAEPYARNRLCALGRKSARLGAPSEQPPAGGRSGWFWQNSGAIPGHSGGVGSQMEVMEKKEEGEEDG